MGNMHNLTVGKTDPSSDDPHSTPVISPLPASEGDLTNEPNQEDIEQVIRIIETGLGQSLPLTPDELTPRWQAYRRFVNAHKRKAFLFGVSILVVIPLLYWSRSLFPKDIVLPVLMIYAIASSTTLIAAMLAEALLIVPTMQRMRSKPFEFFVSQLRSSAEFDFPTARALSACHPNAVKFVHRQFQYHRASLEKRGASLSGNIDKIGLFPALAALGALWVALSNAPYGPWLVMLVPVIFVFHLLNLYSFGLQFKLDRMLAVLEYTTANAVKK
jgi:hypothetical protein